MKRSTRRFAVSAAVLMAASTLASSSSSADEGGVSFWLPGLYGSLAALPGEPGWSFGTVGYHTSVNASGNKLFPQGGELRAGIDADVDIVAFGPTYVFEDPILGGQPALSLLGLIG